jgi:hypothetical protein
MSIDLRDSLSALLPSPRSDEPGSLRQDILDELADHLTCSYHRELLRGSNSTDARARALERFGDPAAMARRLWLDAMKGRIMAQRILIGTCILVTAASLSLVGLFWNQSIQAQRMAAAQRAEAAARENEVLKQLHAMSEAVRNPRSLDWNPLKFKLTEGTPDGPPVADVDVTVQSASGNGQGVFGKNLKSDTSGIVDFGLVNPGEYTFSLRQFATRMGGVSRLASVSVSVQPGSETFKHIVCPKTPDEQAPVKVKCSWPADLEKEGLVLYVSFAHDSRRFSDLFWHLGLAHALMAEPATPPFEILRGMRPYLWRSSGQRELSADVPQAGVRALDASSGSFQWELGFYRLTSMIVLRATPDASVSPSWKRYQVIAGCIPPRVDASLEQRPPFFGSHGGFRIHDAPPNGDKPDPQAHQSGGGFDNSLKYIPPGPNLHVSDESWNKVTKGLEIRSGQVNEWAVSLPEEFIAFVRARLKDQKTSETHQ